MENRYLRELLGRFFQGTMTPEEKKVLYDWINESKDQDLTKLMKQAWEQYEPGKSLGVDQSQQMIHSILSKAKSAEGATSAKIISLRPRKWWRIAAAAILIGLAGIGINIFF